MKLRHLLPLTALPFVATIGLAQNTESVAQLRRDFNTVQQQRDAFAEQLNQLRAERDALLQERDALRGEQESAKAKLAAAETSAVEASEAVKAQKEAEMTVDMTVRAYAIKEQEAIDAVKAAQLAAEKQHTAEQERDAALAEAQRTAAERDAAKQAEAEAAAAKAAMQNELYAAQIRIENLSRALAARSGVPYAPGPVHTGALAPTPVALDNTPAAATPAAEVSTPPPTTTVRTHTVAEGESLSLIAFKYYQSPNKWDKIVAANRAKLKNPDMLRPGMVLVIP
ncbi:MAG TPA: LysM peptidoglycan-binding domain-containing protein [Opitutaceae bacterium]|nr:LysM peptidoglycan-binding domain-containing protein [Opitutaceae bacterium]